MQKISFAMSIGLACVCTACVSSPTSTSTTRYSNSAYHFQFDYPATAQIREEIPHGTAASLDVQVLSGQEENSLDNVVVRVYEDENVEIFGDRNGQEGAFSKIERHGEVLIQIFGGENSDTTILQTVMSRFQFVE